MIRFVFAALLTFLPDIAAAQEGETRRYFEDWLGACRADGYCSAIAYVNPNPGDGRTADHWLRIGRHAQDSFWEISFTPIVVMADTLYPFIFTVDEARETFTGFAEIAPYGAVNDFFLLGAKAQTLMDRLMPGKSLTVSFTDETGAAVEAGFSLNGLTDALMWIDGQQKRVGSERVAELPPVGLSPAFDLQNEPVLSLTTVRLVTIHNDRSGCSIRIDEESYDRVWPVAVGQYETLFVVPCEDFAYNFISALYVGTDQGIAPVALPQSDAAAGALGNTIYSPEWDEVNGELHSFYKGGNGNCGSQGRWTWTGEAFELIELRARETCDESTDEWPVVAKGTN
jgi:hypothetical protein